MMEASLTTDWITVGTAVVAATGTTAAAVAAWRSAEASRQTSQLAADALVKQTERDAAIAADVALRALEVDAQATEWQSNLGTFHNRWQDEAAVPAMRLRNVETRRRVQLVGHVLFLAMQAKKGEHTSYAVLAAIEDARAGLDAFLKHEQPAAPGFPDRNQLTDLCPIRTGGRSFEPLNNWLAQHFPGFRQLT